MPAPSTTLYPGAAVYPEAEFPRIVWGSPTERYYQTGVDRGVLYPRNGSAVPWNGLTGINESSNTSSSILYRDGRIYLADVDPGDFEGSLTAFMWPDEFSVCMGFPEATDGLYVDNQKPKRFGLSYRTLIGSGEAGDMFGYQIHLLYNLMAQPGDRSRKTMTNTPAIMDFNFGLVATPVALPGFRPSAHYILDTRHLDKTTLAQLEDILYGSPTNEARMPTPTELFDLMNFGSSITFIDHGDGTWTARGAYANVHMTGPDTWEILNVNGTDHGDGTFTLEDTP